ncbi:MAG: hypothetical protein ACYS26_03575 [Planctomycetota bacterium]|jgi:hypothetical protein
MQCPSTRPSYSASLVSRGRGGVALLGLLACGLITACESPAEPQEVSASASETPMKLGQMRIGEIDWYVDYAVALEAARTRDLPLWVHFGEHPG